MDIVNSRDLGQRIRARRKEVGLTAEEAARAAGVSRRLLLELEQGKRDNVSLAKVLDILSALGLRMSVGARGLPGKG
jgi:transcriptional regulator with XRE-family HTH domain